MKNLIILAVIAIFLTSCSKETDPVLTFKFETPRSEKWSNASFQIDEILFFNEEDETIGVSMIQQFNSVSFDSALDAPQSFVITEDNHWEMDVLGMKLLTGNLVLKGSGTDQATIVVQDEYKHYVALVNPIQLENNKAYEVVFTLDFDECISLENGNYKFLHNYSVEILEK